MAKYKREDTAVLSNVFTFLGTPFVPVDSPEFKKLKPRACLLGMTWDGSTVTRTGSAQGPAAVRGASASYLSYYDDYDVDVVEAYNLVDAGDCPIVPGNAAKTLAASCQKILTARRQGCLPVVMGGDHSITIAPIWAMAKQYKKLGFIHFDSHLDTADVVGGEKLSNWGTVRRAVDTGVFHPRNMASIGIRGALNPKFQRDYVKEKGITIFGIPEIEELGIREVARKALEIAGNGTEGFYLTVDMDSLDAACVPGTSCPTPGGITSRELFAALDVIARGSLVGFDVVEVNPAYDHAGVVAFTAAQIILLVLAAHEQARKSGTKK